MKAGRLSGTVAWSVLLFLHLPVLVLIIFSFNDSRFGGKWRGFTWDWYIKLFENGEIGQALKLTLIIGVISTLTSVVLGTASALSLHRAKGWLSRYHFGLIYLPLAVPDLLMGISTLLFFVLLGIDLGRWTIIAAHTTFCIGYVAMVILARLQDFDFSCLEAARDLGANQAQTLYRVLIPQLRPGMIAGGLLAFTLSMDDFVITFFVAGPGATTLPLRIYSMIKFGSPPLINALSTILILVTILAVAVQQKFQKGVPYS